eukprot:784812_1
MAFACDIGSHCEMGQILNVKVVSPSSSDGTNDPPVTEPPVDESPTNPPNAINEPKEDDPPTSSHVESSNKFLGFAVNVILLYAFIAVQ